MKVRIASPQYDEGPYHLVFESENENTNLEKMASEISAEVQKVNTKLGFTPDNTTWYFDLPENNNITEKQLWVILSPVYGNAAPNPADPKVNETINNFIKEFAKYLNKIEPIKVTLEMPAEAHKSKSKPR